MRETTKLIFLKWKIVRKNTAKWNIKAQNTERQTT